MSTKELQALKVRGAEARSQDSVKELCRAQVLQASCPSRGRCCGLLFHHFSWFFICLLIYFLVRAVWGGHACVHACTRVCGIQRTPQIASTILPCFVLFCVVLLKRGLLLAWNLPSKVGWLANMLQRSTCLHPYPDISHPPPHRTPHPLHFWALELQARINMRGFLLYWFWGSQLGL